MLISRHSVAGCKWNLVEIHVPSYITLREVGNNCCFRRPSLLCCLSVLLRLPSAEMLDLTSHCRRTMDVPQSKAEPAAPSSLPDLLLSFVLRPRAACPQEPYVRPVPYTHASDLSFVSYHTGCIYAAAGTWAGALKQIQVNIPMPQPHLTALHPRNASCAMMSLCINGRKSGTPRMQKGKDVSVDTRTPLKRDGSVTDLFTCATSTGHSIRAGVPLYMQTQP